MCPDARTPEDRAPPDGPQYGPVTTPEFVLIALTVVLGAFVQGASGFGLGMLAAPIIALVDPTLIPALIIMLATVLTAGVALRERHAVNRAGVGWSLLGRLPGSAAGAALVAVLSPAALGVTVALVVLGGAAVSLRGWAPVMRRRNFVSAGMVAGVMGTATSIGGPPMALMFQRAEPAEARATLSVFFLVGSLMSLALLLVVGALDLRTLAVAAVLLPALGLGYLGSRLLLPFLDRGRMRLLALVASCTSAVVLLAQQLPHLAG